MFPPNPIIAIVGAGAVGAYYGGRLAQHGQEVHFLLRSDYSAVSQYGWNIRSCDGDFKIPASAVQVYDRPQKMPKADLVIVTLKATANDQFQPLITPLLKDTTQILTLQNGLGNEDRLAELFGPSRILGGLAFICVQRIGPAMIHHIDHGYVRVGEFIDGQTEKAKLISDMFNKSKVPCDVLPSLRTGRWAKLVWNVPFNGLGGALSLDTECILATPDGEDLVRDLMREVIAAARGFGVDLSDDVIEKRMAETRTMGPYKSSMQLDREQGRPMEVEAILGEPLRAAAAAGVATPRMAELYRLARVVNLAKCREPI